MLYSIPLNLLLIDDFHSFRNSVFLKPSYILQLLLNLVMEFPLEFHFVIWYFLVLMCLAMHHGIKNVSWFCLFCLVVWSLKNFNMLLLDLFEILFVVNSYFFTSFLLHCLFIALDKSKWFYILFAAFFDLGILNNLQMRLKLLFCFLLIHFKNSFKIICFLQLLLDLFP